MNLCKFSLCRKYRYFLTHDWRGLFDQGDAKEIVWIGLNPSTADELKLDPTLTRIKGFSEREGFKRFTMLNLFAFRATNPEDMVRQDEPIGRENDDMILKHCLNASMIVAAWGKWGKFNDRNVEVWKLLKENNLNMVCLGRNKDGSPKHPLYVPAITNFIPYK